MSTIVISKLKYIYMVKSIVVSTASRATKMKNEIDKLVNAMCNNVVGGELKQLGALFNVKFLNELRKIIYKNESIRSPSSFIQVDMQLAWIDKAPYAKLKNGIPFNNKVELGDAMFIFNENDITNDKIEVSGKAFILQAKVTKNKYQACSVPITTYSKGNSTYKEYHLYEKWPPFDLSYSTQGSVKASDINLTTYNSDCIRYAWYGVAQYQQVTPTNTEWRCRWMVGKALKGTACNKTLGDLLNSFFMSIPLDGEQVGEYYCGRQFYNNDWYRIVHHVINCCTGLKMPSIVPNSNSFKNRIISTSELFLFFKSNYFCGLSDNEVYKLLVNVESMLDNESIDISDIAYLVSSFYCGDESEYLEIVSKLEWHLRRIKKGKGRVGQLTKSGKFPIIITTVSRLHEVNKEYRDYDSDDFKPDF